MNDKYIPEELRDLLARIAKSQEDMREAINKIASYTDYLYEQDKQKIADLARVRAQQAQGYLAAQQPRRDGDNFPIIPTAAEVKEAQSLPPVDYNAHRKTGNIRPPDERGG